MSVWRRGVSHAAVAAGVAGFVAACGTRPPVAPTSPPSVVPIMAAARLSAEQIVSWFNARQPASGTYNATVPVGILAQYFLDEGADEGVGGDVAFLQSVVETGWFRFGGIVSASANNFGGLGATDANPSPAIFPDARTGVRAQIQHLRAYADPMALTCTEPPLNHPCVDPRFTLVTPKGKAANWNQLGNGNWASSATYASSILGLYSEARAFNGGRQAARVSLELAGRRLSAPPQRAGPKRPGLRTTVLQRALSSVVSITNRRMS